MDNHPEDQVAACAGQTDVFFGAEFETKDVRSARESEAKAICSGCEMRDRCLADAMRHREKAGVWGGLNPEERRELARALRSA